MGHVQRDVINPLMKHVSTNISSKLNKSFQNRKTAPSDGSLSPTQPALSPPYPIKNTAFQRPYHPSFPCSALINTCYIPFVEINAARGTSQPSSGGLSRRWLCWSRRLLGGLLCSGSLCWGASGLLEQSLNLHLDECYYIWSKVIYSMRGLRSMT